MKYGPQSTKPTAQPTPSVASKAAAAVAEAQNTKAAGIAKIVASQEQGAREQAYPKK
ncbi:MAG: hypothetical protein WDN46_12765 [Methylocella sp.]